MRNLNLTLDIYAAIVTLILLIVSIIQSKKNKEINKWLIGWSCAQLLVFLSDIVRWLCRGKIEMLTLFSISFYLEYILCYVCLGFFHYYIIDYLHRRTGLALRWRLAAWPAGIIMSALWIFSRDTRMFYVITYNAVNVSMDYYYLSQLPAMLLLLLDVFQVIFYSSALGSRETFQLVLCMIFPLIAFPLQFAWNAGVLFIGMTISILSRYMTISLDQAWLLAESKEKLAESRVAITLSQIQPHFLYNALGSISALCDIDPELAQTATDHFADYLRMNLDSMKLDAPIPFERELDHIHTYIWLEQMRFGEQLNFVENIRMRDFLLPALSVQPLVENAVKHGICTRQSGGTVYLSTYRDEENIYIKVEDDGVGFEMESARDASDDIKDGRAHIGMQNVKSRLEMMVGGELMIESEPGKGTCAIIRLPAGG